MGFKKLLSLGVTLFIGGSLFSQLPVSTTPQNKNVVLEEFTGIYCVYCPDGHKRANQLAQSNPGDVFLVNVHTGGYADPNTGDPDFRTQFGSGLASQSGLSGYPAGTINRHFFSSYNQNGGTAMSRGDWSNAASVILGQSAYANVALEGTLDVQTRQLTVDVEVHFTADGAQDNNLNVALVQDSILGPQTGASSFYPSMVNDDGEYMHMHMLRHFLTGQWGDVISTTTSGTTVSRQYTYTLPSDINGVPLELGDLGIIAYLDTGQQEIINANDGPITYTNFVGANNATIKEVDGYNEVCKGEYSGSIIVKNNGSDPITSMTIEYDMNGGTPDTYNWTGNLGSLDRTEIDLPMLTFSPNSSNSYNVNITSVNGGSDADNADNSMAKSNIALTSNKGSGQKYKVTVVQDRYGSETTWEVLDEQGNQILSGGPYSDLGNDGTQAHTDSFTVSSPGCFEFKIYDTFGDGINSGYGNGSYKIETTGFVQTVLSGNGKFAKEDRKPFEVTNTTSVSENTTSKPGVSVYPNPTEGQAYLRIVNPDERNYRIEVRNVLGKTVRTIAERSYRKGEHKVDLDLTGQEAGVYFVTLESEESTLTKRIMVSE